MGNCQCYCVVRLYSLKNLCTFVSEMGDHDQATIRHFEMKNKIIFVDYPLIFVH